MQNSKMKVLLPHPYEDADNGFEVECPTMTVTKLHEKCNKQ